MTSEVTLGAQEISDTIAKFKGFCKRRSTRAVSEKTITRYVSIIDVLIRHHSLPTTSVDMDEIARVVTERAERFSEGKLSPATYNTEIAVLRRWVEFHGLDPSEKAVRQVLRFKMFSDDDLCQKRRLKDSDVLVPEDVMKVISHFRTPEWKVLIAVMWDTGARIGELCSLDYEDVTRDQHGFILHIKQSKTKRRDLRLISPDIGLKFFLPYYLNHTGHGALFQTRAYGRITEGTAHKELYCLGKRIGIKIWPTVFRKSASTYWKKTGLLPDPAIRARLGHARNSRIFEQWYLQYGDESQNNTELAAIGVVKDVAVRVELKKCWRCGVDIPSNEDYCLNCSASATTKTLFEDVKQNSELEQLRFQLANVQTLLTVLVNAISKDPKLKQHIDNLASNGVEPFIDLLE